MAPKTPGPGGDEACLEGGEGFYKANVVAYLEESGGIQEGKFWIS